MTATPDKLGPWGPLALSALLHAGLALLAAGLLTALPAPPAHVQHRGAWAGDTFQIDGLVSGRGGAEEHNSALAARPVPAATVPAAPPAKAAPLLAAKTATKAPPPARSSAPVRASARAPTPAPSGTPPLPTPRTAPDLAGAMAAAADGHDASHAGQFGAAGVLPGVRDLAKAFTRALPRAASGDPLWSKLPLGSAGSFHVVIRIDAQRRIADAQPDEKALSPVLKHLLDRTLLMLRAGQFALDRSDLVSGSEKLHVELAISTRAPSDQIDVNPSDTIELGFKPPTHDKPGRGYFTLASGRHVEAKVSIQSSSEALLFALPASRRLGSKSAAP